MCMKIYTPKLGSTHLKTVPWCWESEHFRFHIQQFASFLNTGCHSSRLALGAALLLLDTAVGRAPEAVPRHALRCPVNEGMRIRVRGSVGNWDRNH